MKELPTLPPVIDRSAFDRTSGKDASATSPRAVLPVDAVLEVTPRKDVEVDDSNPLLDRLPIPKARYDSPFTIQGSLADGVDPMPTQPSKD